MIKNILKFIFAGFLLTSIDTFALKSQSQSQSQSQSLIYQVNKINLYLDPQWIRLLHYKKNILGQYISEADGSDFFIHSNGKYSPQDELSAFIELLLNQKSRKVKRPLTDFELEQLPHCQFPARAKWLENKLSSLGVQESNSIPSSDSKNSDSANFNLNLDWSKCSDLSSFLNKLKAQSATLIFSSYYLNNPSSTFGHTFLRLNRKIGSDLLNMGVNYAANSTTDNSFAYALLGLMGGFKGTFTVMPYYYKVREYNDYESRDLWEYELNLSSEELLTLTYHLWELQWTYFDYYFFTENCSYHMLTILEAASPKLNLVDRLPSWIIPSETMRILAQEENLIKKIDYRPSIQTQFNARVSNLDSNEKESFVKWKTKSSDWSQNLDPKSQARVLDTGLDYLDLKHSNELLLQKTGPIVDEKNRWLMERSQLPVVEPLKIEAPLKYAPEKAHSSHRGALRYNSEQTVSFLWKFALHDFLDSYVGYPKDAHIDFMSLEWSKLKKQNNPILEKLHVVSLTSLLPLSEFEDHWSWKMSAGWEREPILSQLGTPIFFKFGYGVSTLIDDSSHLLLYGLAHSKISHTFNFKNDKNFLASFGSLIGLRWLWTEKGSFSMEALPEQLISPALSSRWNVSVFQTFQFSKTSFLELRGEFYENKNIGSLGVFHYF